MSMLADSFKVQKNYTYQHLQGVLLLRLNSIASGLKLTHTEYRLMGILIGLYNKKQQKAFPSLNYMVEVASMSRSTIIRTLKSLTDKNLLIVVKTPGKKNSYHFSRQMLNETTTSATHETTHVHEQIEDKTKRTNIIAKQKDDVSNKTQSLSDYRQLLDKLNAWNVARAKRILSQYGSEKVKNIIGVVEERKPDNAGAYFRRLLDLKCTKIQTKNNTTKIASEPSQIKSMLKNKYWRHIPSGKVLQVLPDVGKHLLIKYYKDENMVLFYYNGLIDKLNCFEAVSQVKL